MARFGTTIAAVLVATVLVAGCGSGDSKDADPSTSPTESTSSPTASTSSEAPTSSAPPARVNYCLFTVASVSRVLGGKWERHPAENEPCVYTSDRGGTFTTSIVEDDIKQGLRDARTACVKGIEPISIKGGGFVCVEETSSDQFVVGNIAARGRLWLVLIVTSPKGVPEAQLAAMVALLETVRR